MQEQETRKEIKPFSTIPRNKDEKEKKRAGVAMLIKPRLVPTPPASPRAYKNALLKVKYS